MKVFYPSPFKSFNRSILFIITTILLLSSSLLNAQSVCQYNAQKGYNMGVEYHDEPFEILEQEDGRFVIWGTSYVPGNSFHITGIRLFANGNPDPSFGVLGKVDEVFSQRNTVSCAAIQNDGKFLVAGYQSISNGVGSIKPYVARFNIDGSVDESFGNGGVFLMSDANGEVKALRYFDDGKIEFVSSTPDGFWTVRLLSNGQLDETYGDAGHVEFIVPDAYSPIGNPTSLIMADSTCFVVNLMSGNYLGVTKVSADGGLDTGFGSDGSLILSNDTLYGNTAAIRCTQALDGHILVSSTTNNFELIIAKLDTASGDFITSFGDNGFVHINPVNDLNYLNRIVLDEANQEYLLLSGDQDAMFIRMASNGTIIPECGNLSNVVDMNNSGSQGFSCGLIDQQGNIRVSGKTGAFDPNTSGSQYSNLMWAYYDQVNDPDIVGITPEVIQVNSPVSLNIQGYGLSAASQVRMVSGSEILDAASFQVVDDEELLAIFYPEDISLGVKNIEVIIPNDTLHEIDAVTVDDNYYIDGDVNYISRTSIRAGADFSFGLSYRNKSSVTMVATPLVIISNDNYSVDLSEMLDYNYEDDETMDELVAYLNSQGIDPSILNSSVVQSLSNRTINSVITPSLAPGQGGVVYGTQSMSSPGSATSTTFFHPNPILPAQSIVFPELIPFPDECSMEATKRAMLAVIPGLNVADIESCYFPTYHFLQIELAQRLQGPYRNIPMNHFTLKLFWDMMQCIDPTHQITQQEFQDFSTQWVLQFSNSFILADGTPCYYFLEASEEVQPEVEPEIEEYDCAQVNNGNPILCVDLGNDNIISVTQCQYDNLVAMNGSVSVVNCSEQQEEEVEDWTEEPGSPDQGNDGGRSGDNQGSGYGNIICVQFPNGGTARIKLSQFSSLDEIYEGSLILVECDDQIDEDLTNQQTCDNASGLDAALVCMDVGGGAIDKVTMCVVNMLQEAGETVEIVDCSDTPDDTPEIPNPDDDEDDLEDENIPGENSGDIPADTPGSSYPDNCDGCSESTDIKGETSHDPNEKLGPYSHLGGTYINDPSMFYSIHFENVDTAAIAASTVLVIDTLDTSVLDLNTFKFTYVSWGTTVIPVSNDVMMVDLRPEMPNILRITTALDVDNGIASCLFETLDTLSLMPTEDVDQGFLPPNITAPEGMGYINFEVELNQDIEPGTTIYNQGHIFFDYNEVISTNIWHNTYDPIAPQSEVYDAIDYTPGMTIANVHWGSDDDDVMLYNVYYNEDASDEWTLWKYHVNVTNSYFVGALDHTFYFMSVAIDSALNVETIPDSYDAFVYMNPLSIDEQDQNNTINIYPNPASDQVIISVDEIRFSQILLVDMMGRIVKTIPNKNRQKQYLMPLDGISSGVYHIQLLDKKGAVLGTEKLVVY